MTEPLWVDPTPLVRWVMPWCRTAQQTTGTFSDVCHGRCPGHAELPGHDEVCLCPCHRGTT